MSTPPYGPQDGQPYPPQGGAPQGYPGAPQGYPAQPVQPTTAPKIDPQAIAGELKKQSPYVLAMIGSGLLALLVSFLPAYYKVSVSLFGYSDSSSASAWNGFFSWVGILLLVAGAALAADHAFGLVRILKGQTLGYALLGAFGAGTLLTLLALFIDPGMEGVSSSELSAFGISIGRGFGYWLILILALAGTAAAFMTYTTLSKPAGVIDAAGFAPAGYGAPQPAQPWGGAPVAPQPYPAAPPTQAPVAQPPAQPPIGQPPAAPVAPLPQPEPPAQAGTAPEVPPTI